MILTKTFTFYGIGTRYKDVEIYTYIYVEDYMWISVYRKVEEVSRNARVQTSRTPSQ